MTVGLHTSTLLLTVTSMAAVQDPIASQNTVLEIPVTYEEGKYVGAYHWYLFICSQNLKITMLATKLNSSNMANVECLARSTLHT